MTTLSADATLSKLDHPMVIVTAAAGGRQAGCLVGFHTQCSLDPVRYLVCISEANHTMRVAAHAAALGIHFLSRDDMDLARLFGEETGDDIDKFAECEWRADPDGVPILKMRGGWLAGPVVDRRPVGDHVAMVIEPTGAGAPRTVPQLGLRDVKDFSPAHPA